MPELLGLPYSPWSEKARWALDARGIAYTSRTYQPLIGEVALRRKLHTWSGVVTVPVFTCDDGAVLADSIDIARWADRHGEGRTLFPPGAGPSIDYIVALSERGLAAGRGLSLLRLAADDAGIVELVPRRLRELPGARALARAGIRRTLRKYRSITEVGAARAAAAAALDELRAALAKASAGHGPKTLFGQFTFADIAATQLLSFVDPPAFGLRLGAATRRSFVDDELRMRFADLVTWRDAIYDAYRPRSEPQRPR